MFDIRNFFSEEELISLTRNLIQIPSHKDARGREKSVAEYIYVFCESNGIDAELQPVEGERCNVLAYLRGDGSGRTLMLNGHTDTVPPYNMTVDPFGAEVVNGEIFGRGAVDMKGALASMLVSMLAIKRSGRRLRGNVIFSGVIGEEEKSEGTEYIVKSGLKADGAIVGEPSNYEYAIGHRGLEWLEIIIKGKAAHGGVPNLGINAIEKAAVLIERIKKNLYPKLESRYNEYMGPSVQAILDRLSTAQIIEKKRNVHTIEAEVHGDGIKMFLMSQGSWVRVISPTDLAQEMKAEIEKMRGLYETP
jgi:acetylornithine deacetylase/succinyl-diaminopimelate desuccinylase